MLGEVIEQLSCEKIIEPFWFGEQTVFIYNEEFGVYLFPEERISWIPGYENEYAVTTRGCIYSFKSSVWLKAGIGKYGHLHVILCKNGVEKHWKIHQLVLLAFIGPCPRGQEVRHFPDRNPANNNLENLKYGTSWENHQDRDFHGMTAIGESNGNSILCEDQVIEIRRLYRTGLYSHKKLAKMFGVSTMPIFQIINHITWKHISEK